jgi:hypothetical protein
MRDLPQVAIPAAVALLVAYQGALGRYGVGRSKTTTVYLP